MNQHQSHPEHDLLASTLQDRATGVVGAPFGLQDVQGRARSIRRVRAATATAAVAAVAAVAVPAVLLLGPGGRDDTLPPAGTPTPTSTTTDTTSTEAPTAPATMAVDTGGQVTGLAWAAGDEIHPPDGPAFTPDVDTSSGYGFTRLGEDYLVTSYDDRGLVLSLVEGSGSVVADFPGATSNPVGNAAGTAAAWLSKDGVQVLRAGSTETALMPGDLPGKPVLRTPIELVGDCGEEGCRFYLSVDGDDGSAAYVLGSGLSGPQPFLPGVLQQVTAVSPDGSLAAGFTSVDDAAFTSCSAVVDVATQEQLWETCDAGGLRFSPDGTRVLGRDPYADGLGHGMWTVLDAADGEQQRRFEGGLLDEAWDGEDDLLAVVAESGTTRARVMRFHVGSQTEAPETLDEVASYEDAYPQLEQR